MQEITHEKLVSLARNEGDNCLVLSVYDGENGDGVNYVSNPNKALREYMATMAAEDADFEEVEAGDEGNSQAGDTGAIGETPTVDPAADTNQGGDDAGDNPTPPPAGDNTGQSA